MDLILTNGKIVTMDTSNPRAEAVAVKDMKIIKVGSNEDVLSLKTANTKFIDLEGKMVTPGFIDAHLHLLNYGYTLQMADLNGSKSIDEIISRTKDFISKSPFHHRLLN